MTIDKPNTLYFPGKKLWVLQEDYFDSTLKILIPSGFTYDGASVPRILWWLIDPIELSEAAALVHDYLYRNAGLLVPVYVLNSNNIPERCAERYFPKVFADDMFLDIMQRWEVDKWKEKAAYNAVDKFGGSAWKHHLEKNLKKSSLE